MFNDFKKSFHSIFHERIESPFWGTLIISWLVWNWKIVYLTLFIGQDKIRKSKIDFIIENYSSFKFIIVYPLISTLFLIVVVPFISNGAFWLSLRFQKWRTDQKNSIERKQLLSLEQSIQLREEILSQESRFNSILQAKNLEIEQMKLLLLKTTEEKKQPDISFALEDDPVSIAQKIINTKNLKQDFDTTVKYIQSNWRLTTDEVDSVSLSSFISNDIIELKGGQVYQLTPKGKLVLKNIVEKQF